VKLAILQLADQGPVESTAIMLRAAGYDVAIPNNALRDTLRGLGCDTVLDPRGLTEGMGYDPLTLPEVGLEAMDTCDLYCDVKAHRNGPKVWKFWPRLKGRTLWVRVNGGAPEHVRRPRGDGTTEDCGNEIDPGCPVLTPNLWYRDRPDAYACWPPFAGWGGYYAKNGRTVPGFHQMPTGETFRDPNPGDLLVSGPPVCLIHNVDGWGYSEVVRWFRYMGGKCYGSHGSPDGLVQHSEIPGLLSRALALVSLRSNDCPGYAMYEAAAACCPMIVPRRLIHRMRMEDFLIPDVTCLVFDRPEPGQVDAEECAAEIKAGLERLKDPEVNWRIGKAAHDKLAGLMWSTQSEADRYSLRDWFELNFPN
jgi:hypothetical protein